MVLCTRMNPRSYSKRVGHSPNFELSSVAIFPWLCRKRRKAIWRTSVQYNITYYTMNNVSCVLWNPEVGVIPCSFQLFQVTSVDALASDIWMVLSTCITSFPHRHTVSGVLVTKGSQSRYKYGSGWDVTLSMTNCCHLVSHCMANRPKPGKLPRKTFSKSTPVLSDP